MYNTINHTKCHLNINVQVCENLSFQVTKKFFSAKVSLTRIKNKSFYYISRLSNSCHADLVDEFNTLTPWHQRIWLRTDVMNVNGGSSSSIHFTHGSFSIDDNDPTQIIAIIKAFVNVKISIQVISILFIAAKKRFNWRHNERILLFIYRCHVFLGKVHFYILIGPKV